MRARNHTKEKLDFKEIYVCEKYIKLRCWAPESLFSTLNETLTFNSGIYLWCQRAIKIDIEASAC